MKTPFSILLTAAVSGWLISGSRASEGEGRFELSNAFPNLTLPDCISTLAVTTDASRREVAGMQRGLMVVLPRDREAAEAPVFLDLRERLHDEKDFEEGLHGLAFHPDFQKNRRFYLCFTQSSPRRTVISEMCALPGEELKADARTERILLELPHPLGNHWGGTIAFGPDGFLYAGIGDGGLRDDPYRLAQSPWSLQGKILRIDVDSRSGALPYGIPTDNPFMKKDEIRHEIWALGFRNPWGLSFDKGTGKLWVADVGQDLWEEVNLVEKGGNYGWSEREGAGQFVTRQGKAEEPGIPGPFIDPVHTYPHSEGISVTGGMVYRGNRIPSLSGKYIFGDWGHGKVWSLKEGPAAGPTGKTPAAEVRLLFAREGNEPRFNPTTIAPDAQGEILMCSHFPSVIYTLKEEPVLANDDDIPDADNENDDILRLFAPEGEATAGSPESSS